MTSNLRSNKELLEVLKRQEFEFSNAVQQTNWMRLKSKSISDFKRTHHTKGQLFDILLNLQVKKTAFGFYKQNLGESVGNRLFDKQRTAILDPNAHGGGLTFIGGIDRHFVPKVGVQETNHNHSKREYSKEQDFRQTTYLQIQDKENVHQTGPNMTRTKSFKLFTSKSRVPKKPNFKAIIKKNETQTEGVFSAQLAKYRLLTPFSPIFLNSKFHLSVSEHATINYYETSNGPRLLVYGGLGNGINHDFVAFDLVAQTFETQKVINNGNWARYGHSTTIAREGQVLVFGGDKHFRRIINPLENSNQTQVGQNFWSVNLESQMAEEIRVESCKKPKHRKFHGTCLFDKNYLLIFGGMKINYKFMNDFWVYDIEERVWHEFPVDFTTNTFLELGIAHHSLACMSADITELSKGENNMAKNSSSNFGEKLQKAIYIFKNHKKNILLDVYLFGGINEANDIIENKLWRLGMKNHDFYFKEVNVKGPMPERRHSHTLNAFPKEKLLIMIGGKSESGTFLRDVNLFRLGPNVWETCTLNDDSFQNGIAGHCAEVIENCIFIFGGITNEGFRVPGITYFTFTKG